MIVVRDGAGIATSGSSKVSSLTVPTPASTVDGDRLVMVLIRQDTTSSLDSVGPLGWSLVTSGQMATSPRQWVEVWTRTAVANGATNYTWDWTLALNTAYAVGVCIALAGAQSPSASLISPSIPVTNWDPLFGANGGRIVAFHVYAGNLSSYWLSRSRVHAVHDSGLSTSPSVVAGTRWHESGAIDEEGASIVGSADKGVALVALPASTAPTTTFVGAASASGAGTQATLARPSGTQAGDLLVACLTRNEAGQGAATWNPPAGWTLLTEQPGPTGAGSSAVWWRWADASDPASWDWSWASSVSWSGWIAAYRSAADPNLGITSVAAWTSVDDVYVPEVVVPAGAVGGRLLLTTWSDAGFGNLRFTGMRQRVDVADASNAASFAQDEPVAAAGGTGTRGWRATVPDHGGMLAVIEPGSGPNQPPTWPPGATLTVTPTSPTTADLSWPAASDPDDGLDHYVVVRDTVDIATVSAPTTSYTDTGATPGATHTWRVDAVDVAGNRTSGPSAQATMPTNNNPPTWPPDAYLNAVPVSPTICELEWSAATDGDGTVVTYRVFRDGTPVQDVAAPTQSWTATGLTPTQTYTWAVEAIDDDGAQSTGGPTAVATQPQSSGGSPLTVSDVPAQLSTSDRTGLLVRVVQGRVWLGRSAADATPAAGVPVDPGDPVRLPSGPWWAAADTGQTAELRVLRVPRDRRRRRRPPFVT